MQHDQSECFTDCSHDQEFPEVDLLSPLELRGVRLKNRIVMSPMCQYSAENGMANDWHLVHLGSRAAGGTGLLIVEATAVTKNGRITPGDLGIWSDQHIEPLARIARFVHSQNAVAGIQLAHAGRKASCDLPWRGGAPLVDDAWPVVAPSALAFAETSPTPNELSRTEIFDLVQSFDAAAQRAVRAGFKVIEIHAAHGYLLHSFLSPLANHRSDDYGGSLENRMRFVLEVARTLRSTLPDEVPLFVRISGTDWVEGGWDLAQSITLAEKLKEVGIDLIDVSSGGVVPKAPIPVEKRYQVGLARGIKHGAGIKTGAVGLITETREANEIITRGDADLVFIGRELLRRPHWAFEAELELGGEPDWPTQYGYAVKRRPR